MGGGTRQIKQALLGGQISANDSVTSPQTYYYFMVYLVSWLFDWQYLIQYVSTVGSTAYRLMPVVHSMRYVSFGLTLCYGDQKVFNITNQIIGIFYWRNVSELNPSLLMPIWISNKPEQIQ